MTNITKAIAALTAADWRLFDMRGNKAAAKRLNAAATAAMQMTQLTATLHLSAALTADARYGADDSEPRRIADALLAGRFPEYEPLCFGMQDHCRSPALTAVLEALATPYTAPATQPKRTRRDRKLTAGGAYDPATCAAYATI